MNQTKRTYPVFIAARQDVLEYLINLVEASPKLRLVGTAVTGEDCLRKMAETTAQIALVDYALPQISGVKIVEYFTGKKPGLISVLVSDVANPDFLRSGMLAGAREFIVTPVTLEDLEFAIERVVQVAGGARDAGGSTASVKSRREDGRVVTAGSGKGGTGVSFICANIAWLTAQAEPSLRIALVDLNLRANDLAAILNCEPTKTLRDLEAVMSDLDATLIGSIAHNVRENLHFFSSPLTAEVEEVFTKEELTKFLEHLRGAYDLVIIDNGAYVRSSGTAAFELADMILVVVVPEVIAVKGAKRFVDSLERLGISKNNLLALLNRWDVSDLPPESIADFIGISIAEKLPDSNIVRGFLDEGRLLSLSDRHEIKKGFDDLINAICSKLSLTVGEHVH